MGPNNQPTTVATPITSPFGNTTQGSQLQGGQDILSQLTAAIQQPNPNYQQIAQTAQTANTTGTANAGTYLQGVQQQLGQAAQLPQMSSDYNSLLQMFQADQGLAQKYTQQGPAQQPSDIPVYGNVTAQSAQMPVLTQANMNNPFTGFTDPGMAETFAADAQSGSQASMNALMNAINYNANQMKTGVGAATSNYQSLLTALGQIANNATANANTQATQPSSTQESAAEYQGIVDKVQSALGSDATETDVWNYIQQNRGVLAAQGYDMKTIDALEKQTAQQVGAGGKLAGSKPTAAQAKAGTGAGSDAENAKLDSLRGFNSLINDYYKTSTNVLGLGISDPLKSSYTTAKTVYARQLAAALKFSKSNATAQSLMDGLPGTISTDPEGGLLSHLDSLLNANGIRMVINKNSGTYGLVDDSNYNPNTQTTVSANDVPMTDVQKILSSL